MSKLGFDKILKNWAKEKDKLALELLNDSKNHFVKNFRSRNRFDKMNESWKPLSEKYRKQKIASGNGGSANLQGKTGKLLAALMNSVKTGSSKWTDCKLVVNIEYASVHNNGSKNIPQRTFIKHTNLLQNIHLKTIYKKLDSLFK